jgi:hypothetical protein
MHARRLFYALMLIVMLLSTASGRDAEAADTGTVMKGNAGQGRHSSTARASVTTATAWTECSTRSLRSSLTLRPPSRSCPLGLPIFAIAPG